ncbi:MAG: serine kinase [Cyanobacteria bacterium P01_A01_bin.123]
MFSYFAYGLGIQSEIAIPEFIDAGSRCDADITLRFNTSQPLAKYLPAQVTEEFGYLKLTREHAIFYIKDAGVFLIEGGRSIVIIPAPEVSESLLRFYLVGTVMGILLYQRGLLVLHASAVNINGKAVAFLGVSGEGKSSTAAAFHASGYHTLTDDVAPVILSQSPPVIVPGFPQIKLSREITTALGYDFELLSPLYPSAKKRGYRLDQGFAKTPLPIGHIYVLTSSPDFGIEPLKPQDAVVELSRHSRPSTLFHKPDAKHFFQCANLAKECALYRLNRPRDLTLLSELVRRVENHLIDAPLMSSL